MSKGKQVGVKSEEYGFTINGYRGGRFTNLEGKLLTIIDGVGFGEKQNKAVKDLIRNEIWNMWDMPDYSYQYNSMGQLDTEVGKE